MAYNNFAKSALIGLQMPCHQELGTAKFMGIIVKRLTDQERDWLAWSDGFRYRLPEQATDVPDHCFDLMLRWWKQTHELPFAGHHIQW